MRVRAEREAVGPPADTGVAVRGRSIARRMRAGPRMAARAGGPAWGSGRRRSAAPVLCLLHAVASVFNALGVQVFVCNCSRAS